jgi:hypothetical protein
MWNLQSSTTHYFGGNPRLGRPDIKFILGLTSIQVITMSINSFFWDKENYLPGLS